MRPRLLVHTCTCMLGRQFGVEVLRSGPDVFIGSRVVDTVIGILRQKESSREAHGSGEIATTCMSLLKRCPRRDAGRKNPEGLKDSAPDPGDSEEGQSTSNSSSVFFKM